MSPMWFKTIKDFITKVEDETEERGQDHVSRTLVLFPYLATGSLESTMLAHSVTGLVTYNLGENLDIQAVCTVCDPG